MAMALAGAWVLADLARQFVATGFPWNPLGSVWEFPGRAGDIMIQVASLAGVHGMTLMTMLLASLPRYSPKVKALSFCSLSSKTPAAEPLGFVLALFVEGLSAPA